MAETMAVQEHLFDGAAQLTETIDFGIDAQSLFSGQTPTPPEGVRLNVNFQGEITGPKLKGRFTGTDYFLWRADGIGVVNVHAVLTTVDGEKIAYHADGFLARPVQQSSTIYQGRENLRFHTASAEPPPTRSRGVLRSSAKADWGRHHSSTLKSASWSRSASWFSM